MTEAMVSTLAHTPRPLRVDGAWLSGQAAAEPGGLMLDLYLREGPDALSLQGTRVWILSFRRGQGPGLAGGVLSLGDQHILWEGPLPINPEGTIRHPAGEVLRFLR
jgi:hypothetical protein